MPVVETGYFNECRFNGLWGNHVTFGINKKISDELQYTHLLTLASISIRYTASGSLADRQHKCISFRVESLILVCSEHIMML